MVNFRLLSALAAGAAALLLAGCSSNNYYQNDGPPSVFIGTSDESAVPHVEPFKTAANRPYTVFGKRYVPVTADIAMKQQGEASWYGKQFHGNKTSIGETYDMYKPSAAHPTMPLPSYARVTNLENGRSVIVRVNDRGPFLNNRIIDLSYAAAKTLGYVNKGTARVEVVRLTNVEIAAGTWLNQGQAAATPVETSPSGSFAGPTVTAPVAGWGVQIGSFSLRENAFKYAAHAEAVLSSSGNAMTSRIVQDGSLYRVIVGQGMQHGNASIAAKDIGARLGCGAFAIEK
mgnify:CR=1 FL=1